jgi:four helix bundle protein
MGTLKSFEEIDAWQKARALTRHIYALTSSGLAAKDFALRDQIRRGSVSVMSNIAEGFGRGGNRELVQFLHIARGSLAEVKSQLYVMLDAGQVDTSTFDQSYDLATSAETSLNGFIKYLSQSSYRGTKFKTDELREPDEEFSTTAPTQFTNL